MQFRIILGGNYYDRGLPSKEVGLDLVDKIRETLSLPNLPLDRINPYISQTWITEEVPITEEEAREFPCFKQKNSAKFSFPKSFYADVEIDFVPSVKASDTGEVLEVTVNQVVYRDKFTAKVLDFVREFYRQKEEVNETLDNYEEIDGNDLR